MKRRADACAIALHSDATRHKILVDNPAQLYGL